MYRYKKELVESSKVVHPQSGAWSGSAVRRSSNYKLQSQSHTYKQDSSEQFTIEERLKRLSTPKSTAANLSYSRSKRRNASSGKPKPSQLFGIIKSVLEDDSQDYDTRLKALEPSIKSLAQGVPKLTSKLRSDRRKPSNVKIDLSSIPNTETQIDFGQSLIPPILQGEKLITVGGYIISLQATVLENLSSMIKPRVSSDKDGLELEIRIAGCDPSEIKFEKRYNTLIIIGVDQQSHQKRFEEFSASTTFNSEGSKWRDLNIKSKATRKELAAMMDNEQHNDITEIINIFVPKDVSLNQVFITKPDAKGRIFVKGP